MAVKHGQLRRSLNAVSFGVVREMDERSMQLAKTALTERDEQFQVRISGTAADEWAWGEVEVTFRTGFVNATGQRDSTFIVPTFTYGSVIDSVNRQHPIPPAIVACVTDWRRDPADIITGAVVAVGASGPGEFDFQGRLHMNFQGYGAPNEAEEGEDDA